MKTYRIKGGNRLSGVIEPVGNKNSVLKLIPASLLFSGDYRLTNVPAISDVQVMVDILLEMGAKVDYHRNAGELTINTDTVSTSEIPSELAKKIRASVVFIGPMLARFGEVKAVFPGGDKIGERELKAHFSSLLQLGVELSGSEWGEFKLTGKPQADEVHFYEPSVTATENLILAAAGTVGITVIKGCACEPHVQELCDLLIKAGVEITGVGSNVITITGREKLKQESEHSVWPDYIDVGTAVISSAVTGGEITVNNIRPQDLVTINFFFNQLGINYEITDTQLHFKSQGELAISDFEWARIKGVYSQPWYGFPSDLMSLMIVLATQVSGSTLFFEKLYPNRMSFVTQLNSFGANIITCDPHRVVVSGKTAFKPGRYVAPDLRAGMAYLMASLIADGESIVRGADHIERGYPDTAGRYAELGAEITIIDE